MNTGMFDKVEWHKEDLPDQPDPDGLPYVTHSGKLEIMGIVLDCVVLSTGQRIFTEESILRALGIESE